MNATPLTGRIHPQMRPCKTRQMPLLVLINMGIEDDFLAAFGNVGGLTNAAQLKARQWFRCGEAEGLVSTTATAFANVVSLNIGSPPAGEFQLLWSFEGTNTTSNKGLDYRVRLDGVTTSEGTLRPSSGGIWTPASGCSTIVTTGSTHILTLDYKAMTASGGVGSAQLRRACICVWRTS